MKTQITVGLLFMSYGYPLISFCDDFIPGDQSALYIRKVEATRSSWDQSDKSLITINEGWGNGNSEHMIKIMKKELLSPPAPIERNFDASRTYVTRILDALYRSGDSPEITNILHQALLAPTNYYRDATFHAYVMASPVPMAFLAETVVKGFPVEQRKAWYSEARRLSFEPARDAKYIDRPSREALRFAHFLYTVKPLETDPECLRVIGNPVDPKRE